MEEVPWRKVSTTEAEEEALTQHNAAGFQLNCAFYGKSTTYPPDGSSKCNIVTPLIFEESRHV